MGERGDKVVTRWRSNHVQRDVTLVRWGSFGQPILMFPTAGGDAEEVERFQMMDVLAPLLDAGRIKIYSCDSVAGKALVTREGSPQHQMWLQNQFHYYIRHEVVPAIRMDCKADLDVWTTGASFGALHATAVLCRFPDVFSRCLAISGSFDLRRFFQTDHFTDDFWVSSPLHFVPRLEGKHLDVLKTRYLQFTSGEGKAEAIWESWAMANALGAKGVPNKVDSWGPEWAHDWITWRKMIPQILDQWTREREAVRT